MKKYTKPEIIFEDFSSSCSIASCKYEANDGYDKCGYYVENMEGYVFVSALTGCDEYIAVNPWPNGDNDASYGKICYHVPDGLSLFGS